MESNFIQLLLNKYTQKIRPKEYKMNDSTQYYDADKNKHRSFGIFPV